LELHAARRLPLPPQPPSTPDAAASLSPVHRETAKACVGNQSRHLASQKLAVDGGLSRCASGSLKRDEIRLNRYRDLALSLSMIFSENRYTLFRIML
jgi:hypothetical protein